MNTKLISSLRLLPDRELIARVKELACRESRVTAGLVAHLAELEERRLHVAEGCASLFTYCTEILHLSEHAACNRIEAARAARKFPYVLEKLADGSVHLTAVRRLAPHLTPGNHRGLLDEAVHRTTRQVEEMIARIRPAPPAASSIRKLPARAAGASAASSARCGQSALEFAAAAACDDQNVPAISMDVQSLWSAAGSVSPPKDVGNVPSATPELIPATPESCRPVPKARRGEFSPLAPDLYRVQFTADAGTYQALCQARELLRHQVPDGDAATVIGLALKLMVRHLARRKFAETTGGKNRRAPRSRAAVGSGAEAERAMRTEARPKAASRMRAEARTGATARATTARTSSRHIPAEVKRHVWRRDGGQCAFTARNGRRCSERGRLEFHHVRPFARGGPADVENIQLRCRAHNIHEAELCFAASRFNRKAAHNRVVSKRVENVMHSQCPETRFAGWGGPTPT